MIRRDPKTYVRIFVGTREIRSVDNGVDQLFITFGYGL